MLTDKHTELQTYEDWDHPGSGRIPGTVSVTSTVLRWVLANSGRPEQRDDVRRCRHCPQQGCPKKPLHGFEQSITITLPPMSVLYFEVPAKRARKTAGEKAAEKAAPKKASRTAKAEKAEEKAPAKRGRKPKAEAAPAEEKAPEKRGRKPKAEKAAEPAEKPARKPCARKADKAEK